MRASRRRCLRAVSGGRCNAPRLRSLAPLETKEGTGCLHPVTAEFPDAFRFPHGFQAPTPSWSWLTSPPPSLRIFFPNLEHDPGGGTAPCSRGGRNRARPRDRAGASWLRFHAFATSVASLATSSSPYPPPCAFLGRISAQMRSLSSSIAALAALAAPAHRAVIESRIVPRSARPAASQRPISAATGRSSSTSRATARVPRRRDSNYSVVVSLKILTPKNAGFSDSRHSQGKGPLWSFVICHLSHYFSDVVSEK